MIGKKKKEWLKSNIGQFVKDRQYDRKVEKLIKRMDPRELSELLNEESSPESKVAVGNEKDKN